MTSRVGGDFNQEAVEAFRLAYAQQLQTPDDNEIDQISGLPTNVVPNTSPWLEHTGLWRYPSGRGPDQDLKQPFNPNAYLSDEVIDGGDEIDSLSEEEVDSIINGVPQED